MADPKSIKVPPGFLLSRPIRPAIVRGSLVHQVVDVQFVEFCKAACAWSAIDALVDRRRLCLATLKANAGPTADDRAFSLASSEEAQLAAQIHRLRRAGGPQ